MAADHLLKAITAHRELDKASKRATELELLRANYQKEGIQQTRWFNLADPATNHSKPPLKRHSGDSNPPLLPPPKLPRVSRCPQPFDSCFSATRPRTEPTLRKLSFGSSKRMYGSLSSR